ncbi:hypothetical protein Mal35_16530 [Gimesia maris]|nr:hypothetical protein Mal35_16530 [Gimesia maris]
MDESLAFFRLGNALDTVTKRETLTQANLQNSTGKRGC